MKRLALTTLVTALGVGILFTIPDMAAAQRESPLPDANRMHPDTSALPLARTRRSARSFLFPTSFLDSAPCTSIPLRSPRGRSWLTTIEGTW